MEGEGKDDVMWQKHFEKLYVSIINTVGHCRDVTVFTMSRDVSSVKVERVEKADYSDSNPKTSNETRAELLSIWWVDFSMKESKEIAVYVVGWQWREYLRVCVFKERLEKLGGKEKVWRW